MSGRTQKLVGKLMLSLKLLFFFYETNDKSSIKKLESCFSTDFKTIRKPVSLDLLLKQHISVLKQEK
jgi:hypothetical protein